jgi:hypothetical protein
LLLVITFYIISIFILFKFLYYLTNIKMARHKKFRRKTFRKKHKSRRGRKITSNKTRHFRGGIDVMDFSKGLIKTAAKGAVAAAATTPQGRIAAAVSKTPIGQALQAKVQEKLLSSATS